MKTAGVLEVVNLGRVPYSESWELQKNLQRHLINKTGSEILLVCEHAPVITIGRSGSSDNILVSRAELDRKGVELFEVERGGDVTYHGPGQVVAYPILDLTTKKRDVGWYMRALEEVILQCLQAFDVSGMRIPGKTGVWTQPTGNAIDFGRSNASPAAGPRKIASLGVRISRWCTMHGISLNVRDCREGFRLINPCGFTDIEMSSIEQETGKAVSVETVLPVLVKTFASVFEFSEIKESDRAKIESSSGESACHQPKQ